MRINEIRHDINADIEGRRVRLYRRREGDALQQIANMPLIRYVMRPLMTFDQMLKMLGNKSIDGKGYMWMRFIRDGIIPASEKEYKGYQAAVKKVDDKVSELFAGAKRQVDEFAGAKRSKNDNGKGRNASWLRRYTSKGDTVEVTLNDMGEERTYKVTRGAVMAVYAWNKMNDGKMKLRRMGITEEDVARMTSAIDSRLIEFMDWVQGDLLPGLRPKYAKVYENINGTSMPEVENYFPMPILETDLEEKDKVEKKDGNTRPATTTGSWKKRTVNRHALDILNSDAVEILFDNIKENEHMAAYGELNRDLNTMLSSKRLKLAMHGMTTTAYGAGKELWENFKDCVSVAVEEYRPKSGKLDTAFLNLAKGVTSSKIWFGEWTAAKQATSLPANLTDMKMRYFAEALIQPWTAWNWAIENLPLFEKRWKSKMSGDPRLMPTDVDWKLWKSRIVEIAQRLGLTPNAFIDALTCAEVAYPVYRSKIDKYNRLGYGADRAHALALRDAEIAFNLTQQSSEGAFLSPMQKDRTFFSVLYTTFRNASMAYTRQYYESARNLERLITGQISVEYMAKQILRDSETRTMSEIFDAELEQQIAGTLPVGHIYQLGKPGGVLRSAGIEDLPIELSSERLAIKASEAYRSGHPFRLEAVKGLVKAINNPIAVFDSVTRAGATVILTTLKHNGNNFIVALEAQNSYTHRTIEADINSVLSIYPKEAKNGILHWIANGALRYCDHKKTRDFFAEQWADSIDGKSLDITLKPDAKQRTNLAEVKYLDPDDVAKIMNNFDNPKIPEQKVDESWSAEDWEKARKFAKEDIRRAAIRNAVNLGIYGWILSWLWRIGGNATLLILGSD